VSKDLTSSDYGKRPVKRSAAQVTLVNEASPANIGYLAEGCKGAGLNAPIPCDPFFD